MNAAVIKADNSSSDKDGYQFISNDYFTNRFKKMHALQRQGKLCDILVRVGGQTFCGHKLVFASVSEYFSDMFDDNKHETILEHQIGDISPMAFRSLLQFFYTGKIVITTAIVQDIIKASKRFKIDSLEEACQNSMSKLLNPTTCLQIKNIAGQQRDEKLYQKCHVFALHHFDEIAETEAFLQLPFSEMKKLISDEEILVTSEEKMYSAVIKWTRQDSRNRATHLSELMAYVKLPLLDKAYCVQNVVREPLMRENTECFNLLTEATDYHMGMKYNKNSPRFLPRKHYRELPYIFVAGGFCDDVRIADCEVYDTQTNRWCSISSLPSKKSGMSLIGFKNKLYAFGGLDHNGKAQSTVEYYNPLKDSWTTYPKFMCLPSAGWGHGLCSIDNHIYICGGKTSGKACVKTVNKCDPNASHATFFCVPSKPMKTNRAHFTPAVADNRIYAFGGETDDGKTLNTMETFDPREGKWCDAPPMSTPRYSPGVAVMDGYIYTSSKGSSWECFNIRRNAWEPISVTLNEEGPSSQAGSVYLTPSSSHPIQLNTNHNTVFQLPPMLKKRYYPGITVMNCLKIKLTE